MNSIHPIPYTSSWFPILNSWVTDKDVLLQYSGTHFRFPLTEAQMETYALEFPDRKMYMGLLEDETPFAFGEIIPQDEHSVRLARILIGDPGMRGRGLGLAFVNALVAEAQKTFEASVIDLFVFSTNLSAIHCYEKAGFVFSGVEHPLVVDGITYTVKKMSLS